MLRDTSDSSITNAFQAFIGRDAFPCLGAKAAAARQNIRVLCADDLQATTSDALITRCLQDFAAGLTPSSLYVSLAVTFAHTVPLSEKEFEDALWARLQAIHDIDALTHDWDADVSTDVTSPDFSMSVGGKAFYVLGLHPLASRLARRFDCPVLVFNLHSQFELLRADGHYEKLRDTIINRDIAFCGSHNPMLAVHGTVSEARQYSGRKVDAGWQCPFKAKQAG